MERFYADVRGDEAKFPDFAFIEPKYFGVEQDDDHPPHNVMKAQKLVADVYNAIRANDALFESTLLLVVYDEHGGFYDHVPPPAAVPPDGKTDEYTFDRLGVRDPAVLVSPWLDARVDSTVFDHTSLLKYLQDKWALGPLGARTAAANSVGKALAWRDAPREDATPYVHVPMVKLVPERPDWERQDPTTHHGALHLAADALEAADDAIEAAVEGAARAAEAIDRALPRLRARMGDQLIAWGRELRGPLEAAQRERARKTQEALRRKLGR
jgi:phospholipase C